MAKAGQGIYNPRQKDTIIFKQTVRETGGGLLQLEIFTAQNAAPPPVRVHSRQEEHFQIVSGTLRARVGGEARTLRAGERMVVPPRVAHTWWIGGEEVGHVMVEFSPALHTETFFETICTASPATARSTKTAHPLCYRWRSSAAPMKLPALSAHSVPEGTLCGSRSRGQVDGIQGQLPGVQRNGSSCGEGWLSR
jgi:mannose-6-phosphate isomerase-like protein (cupin superfamily)